MDRGIARKAPKSRPYGGCAARGENATVASLHVTGCRSMPRLHPARAREAGDALEKANDSSGYGGDDGDDARQRGDGFG